MQSYTQNSVSEVTTIDQVKTILFILQEKLAEFSTEVDRSYKLLKIGEKTQFTKELEATISNPLENVFTTSKSVDLIINNLIEKFVESFLKMRLPLIHKAYKSEKSKNDHYYFLVLIQDNIEVRDKIFDFYDKYNLIDISTKHPVYFHFCTTELISKIDSLREINLK
jgi:hypothetical protein